MAAINITGGAQRTRGSADGFSLIEVLISTFVLTTGLLSLVGVMVIGLNRVSSSSAVLIAREKAREAVESVHTARDTGAAAWATIRNTPQGGVFLTGPRPLTTPGADGLVNTADDGAVETMRSPGVDGILGTDTTGDGADDVLIPLTDFTREIVITDLMRDGTTVVNPNLRQITVTVRYMVNSFWRAYTLRTFVSSFS